MFDDDDSMNRGTNYEIAKADEFNGEGNHANDPEDIEIIIISGDAEEQDEDTNSSGGFIVLHGHNGDKEEHDHVLSPRRCVLNHHCLFPDLQVAIDHISMTTAISSFIFMLC